MNDLINEEDFLQEKYNPKKWFAGFYIGGIIIELTAFYVMNSTITSDRDTKFLFAMGYYILVPMLISFVMIFGRIKNVTLLESLEIAKAIFLLIVFCYLSIFAIAIYYNAMPGNINPNSNFWLVTFIAICLSIVTYVITIGIVLFFAKIIKKFYKKTSF